MTNKKNFNWITRIQESEFKDDVLYIAGLASTRESRDSYGTRPSEEILNYMLEKAPLTNLHLTHGWDNANLILNNVVGRIKEAEIRNESDLWIKASIVYPDIAENVKRLIDNDVLLGFSIGGYFDISRDGEFIDGNLYEISLVSIPAVAESQGTVTVVNDSVKSGCFGAICRSMNIKSFKKKEDKNMVKNNKKVKKTNRDLFDNNKDELEEFKSEVVNELTTVINNGFNDFKSEIIEDLKEEVKKEVKDELLDELEDIENDDVDFNEDSETEEDDDDSDDGSEGTERSIDEDDDEGTERAKKKKGGAEGSEDSEEEEDDEKKKEKGKGKNAKRSLYDGKTIDEIKEEVRREILDDLVVKRNVKGNSKTSKISRDLKKLREKKEVKRTLTPEEAAKLI